MSIPRRYPIVELGDSGAGSGTGCYVSGYYSAWRVDGMRDEVSDRGALYPSFAANGTNVDLSVYSDPERTQLVAQGLNQDISQRVVADPVGTSRLTVSCLAESNQDSERVTLWVWLATLRDIEERESDAAAFFRGSAAMCPFETIALACMRQFYLNMQAIFPPPQRSGAPLALHGTGPGQIAGKRGLPDLDAVEFWSLNPEGDWELVGLQNAADFKEWAIAWCLGLIWKRQAGSMDDPVLRRSQLYHEEAADQWNLLPFQVDFERDGSPDREVRRSNGGLISRG